MKRFSIIFLVLGLVCSAAFSANIVPTQTEDIKMGTSFSFTTSCFTGFSKKPIDYVSAIPEDDKYADGGVIKCKFNPQTNKYESDVFYAYCQQFSVTDFTVELYAPVKMKSAKTGIQPIKYQLKSDLPNAKAWVTKTINREKMNYVSWPNEGITLDKPRVKMCQPIQLLITNTDVKYGETYTVDFTIGVIAK